MLVFENSQLGNIYYIIRTLAKKKSPTTLLIELLAEREGFEPPVPLSTTVFKTVVIDHSTISPEGDKISASRTQKTLLFAKAPPDFADDSLEIGCKGSTLN